MTRNENQTNIERKLRNDNADCLNRRHDTQHNDTQHNDTQHTDTQHTDTSKTKFSIIVNKLQYSA
jgi:hypothetical protein